MLEPQSQPLVARQSPVQPSRTAWSSQAPSELSDGRRPAVPTQVGHPQPKQRRLDRKIDRRADPLNPARTQLLRAPILTATSLRPMRSVLNCPEQLQDQGSAQTSMAAQEAGEPRRFD